MSYVSAVVLAAGKGLRFFRQAQRLRKYNPVFYHRIMGQGKPKISKPLVKLKNKPLIIYPLKVLNHHPQIKEIILVANRKNIKKLISEIKKYHLKKIKRIVLGGLRRQDSVYNGLKALNEKSDLVLIHDGLRPFVTTDMVTQVIKAGKKEGAAIVGVPVKATIKEVMIRNGTRGVHKTLERKKLWEIQTPQVFRKNLILNAYKKFGRVAVTDDATLVEKMGIKVSIVCGSYNNIKITTPEDLIVAEAIAKLL